MNIVLTLDSLNIPADDERAEMVYNIARKNDLQGYLVINRKAMTNQDCHCITWGQDNGMNTCWVHHNCADGSCTHQE